MDEQVLSGTSDISIRKDNLGQWNVRDFGRGLRIEHFTQNESPEKTGTPKCVIGKYGVGLKDALAVLYRNGIVVNARSRHGFYRLGRHAKGGFGDIRTLHVLHTACQEPGYIGTVFVFAGLGDDTMLAAKSMFLRFCNEELLSKNDYGEIRRVGCGAPRVYVSGVMVNEEPNFLFSYNITSVTERMRGRMGRERVNVGRSVYADRVKDVILSCSDDGVWNLLANQIARRDAREICEELQWIEVRARALSHLHRGKAVVYVTREELKDSTNLVDMAQREERSVVLVTDVEKQRLSRQNKESTAGNVLLEDYAAEYAKSFQYSFVSPEALTAAERGLLELAGKVLELVPMRPSVQVLVSETLRPAMGDTLGAWDAENRRIIIRRDALASLDVFCGILLHEVAHAVSGLPDVSREFESELTRVMGLAASAYCRAEQAGCSDIRASIPRAAVDR